MEIENRRNTRMVFHQMKSVAHRMSYSVLWDAMDYPLHQYSTISILKSTKDIRSTINTLLLKLHHNLPLMKLNKYTGRFDTLNIWEGFDSCYLGDEICCVCLEKTTTLTTCAHSICVDCCHHMHKLKPSKTLSCPTCRRQFQLFNSYDDTDDDDDEDDDDDDDEDDDDDDDEEVIIALAIGVDTIEVVEDEAIIAVAIRSINHEVAGHDGHDTTTYWR